MALNQNQKGCNIFKFEKINNKIPFSSQNIQDTKKR